MRLVSNNGPLISKEEKEVLIDICNRCFFPSKKEKAQFFQKVCESVNCNNLNEITEEKFEMAFNKAISILHKIGEDVFRPKRNWKDYCIPSTKIKFNGGF